MAWAVLATLTPSTQWAFSPITDATYFRIKHVNPPTAPIVWVAQAQLSSVGYQIFDSKKLSEYYLEQVVKFGLDVPEGRVVAIKTNVVYPSWRVEIEADIVPDSSDGESQNPAILQKLDNLASGQATLSASLTVIAQKANDLSIGQAGLSSAIAPMQTAINQLSTSQTTRFDSIDTKLEQIYQKVSTSSQAYDFDAQKVIDAIQSSGAILSTDQKDACNSRIVAMKSNGIWNKRIAYYGFLGGTAPAHAINWKNPGTHDIIWNGSLTHSALGVQGDGTTGYGNSGILQTLFNARNTHFAVYVRNNSDFKAGVVGTGSNATVSSLFLDSGLYRSARGSSNGGNNADARSVTYPGWVVGSALPIPDIKIYKNGIDTTTSTPSGQPEDYIFNQAHPILIFALNSGGSPIVNYLSSSQISSFSLGIGLIASEILADYNSEQAYQTALNRNI